MSRRDINFAISLATGGYTFDCEIQEQTKKLVKAFPKADLFLIAIVQSLTWTGHAIDKIAYFKKALEFLKSGSEQALSGISECAGRYGPERLKVTLFNWKRLYNELGAPSDIFKSSLEEIILFQKTSLKTACMAKRKSRVIGIGAWLFCAPFKIIVCLREELWSHDRVDEILMPLGLEVVRGVRKVIRERYSYANFVDIGDLSEEEGDIVEGLGTVQIVQAMSKEIASDGNSIVVHINSGLWKLGAGDL